VQAEPGAGDRESQAYIDRLVKSPGFADEVGAAGQGRQGPRAPGKSVWPVVLAVLFGLAAAGLVLYACAGLPHAGR
jgi:hypothetical protein